MRPQADLPRRPPRFRRGQGRGRSLLIVAAVVLFFLITSLRGIAGFYTDYLWFDSLGPREVWRGVLGAKVALAVIFTVAVLRAVWVNLLIADRMAPRLPAVRARRKSSSSATTSSSGGRAGARAGRRRRRCSP